MMGMVGYFAAIDPKTQSDIQDDPTLLEEFLYPDDGDTEPQNSINVDKAWHGIHYLLARQSDNDDDPLKLVVFGGQAIGDDLGYGPARFLNPSEVRNISTALGNLSFEDFKKEFDPAAMTAAEIYPEVIWERETDDALDYVVDNFRKVVVFYRDAANRGDGAVLWLA